MHEMLFERRLIRILLFDFAHGGMQDQTLQWARSPKACETNSSGAL
jgi:hypothetical protein